LSYKHHQFVYFVFQNDGQSKQFLYLGPGRLYGAALQRPSAQVVPSGQAEQAGPWVGWFVGTYTGKDAGRHRETVFGNYFFLRI
jgi:hypothetical protein